MANIRVNCTCGKLLKIPDKYAGKKGRCPNCGKKIKIPTVDVIRQEQAISRESFEVESCPTCGAYLNPGDEVCVSCNMNLKTGEWDSEGRRGSVPSPSKLHYLGAAAICALLIIGGIYLMSQLERDEKSLSTWPENTIRDRGPDSRFDAKNMNVGKMGPSVSTSETIPSQNSKQSREEAAQKAYQAVLQKTQDKKDALMRWVEFKEIAAKYNDTDYIQQLNEQGNPLADAIAVVQVRKESLKSAYDQNKYAEVLQQGTEWLGEVVRQSYPEEKLQRELSESVDLCREAFLNYQIPISPEQPANTTSHKDDELLAVKEKFTMYMKNDQGQWKSLESYYREKVKTWQFDTLAAQIAPLALEADRLKEKYPQADMLKEIAKIYHEAQLLQKFWQCAKEAVQNLKKQKKTVNLLLKKGDPEVVTGKIVKYEDETIYLKTLVTRDGKKKPETLKFGLSELSARGLVMLISRTKSRDKKFYTTAACFYYINDDPTECRSMCDKALDNGALVDNIARYHKWALGEISEKERILALSKAAREKLEAEEKEKNKNKSGEKIVSEAWNIIENKLLPEYRKDNTRLIFKYLEQLQRQVPRDELIKLNSEMEKKWGQSLYSMADKAFTYCTYCKNTGKIKCPDCKGDGYIESEKVLKSTITSTKKYCTRCGGSGEIYCPKCYHKRHNRKYCMLIDYYDEID